MTRFFVGFVYLSKNSEWLWMTILEVWFYLFISMSPKYQRLTGKEINYMLKRGKRYYGQFFIFRVIPQYTNKHYNQLSIQIPLKVDKRATTRNMLKRVWYKAAEEFYTPKQHHYVKVFASANKKNIWPLIEYIATQEKTAIVQYRANICKKDFDFLMKSLKSSKR